MTKRLFATLITIFIIIIAGLGFAQLYTDWLWFDSLHYSVVFSTILWSKIGLGIISGVIFFGFLYLNLWLARKLAPPPDLAYTQRQLLEKLGNLARLGIGILSLTGSAVIAVLVGLEATAHYKEWLYWAHSVSFSQTDPVLGVDISFYVFRMPFAQFLYDRIFFGLIVAGIGVILLYIADQAIRFSGSSVVIDKRARVHIGTIGALLFLVKAYGYRLAMFNLLTNRGQQFDGPGYTDIHAVLPALWFLGVLAIICGFIVFGGVLKSRIKTIIGAIAVQLIASVLLLGGYPYILQRFIVGPNQSQKETPYIKKHIKATQVAFGLEDVKSRQYPADTSLAASQVSANESTIENIRLWDAYHIKEVYAQTQTIQQYYHFTDVDVDRYMIGPKDGEKRYRQVWLSARELSQATLPEASQTWINKRLRYTHGYGLAMSPINEVSTEGLPNYFISDIPPKTNMDMKLDRMGVYFGEMTDEPVFVKTSQPEFDYPTGNTTHTTQYQADSGIKIGSFFRKLLFAFKLQDINILLNANLTSESQLLYKRNVTERVSELFPFLTSDKDPYLVLADGRLYWMMDAYTTSNRYPYSHSINIGDKDINYIRNSVKIVVDAYSGEVNAYTIEKPKSDPIIRAYSDMFPGIFKNINSMPKSLAEHIRYPELLFRVQTYIYETYHMSSPSIFYQRSDVWEIPPKALLEDELESDTMEPYYTIMKLPNADTEEFILMTVFRRKDKTNMVAWMCAKCDPQDYGNLVLYEFPEDRNVPGPQQIKAKTNQDTYISQQLSLWNQRGSGISSGNLLIMPIDTSILYVMPLYLESTTTKIPELKRVIVALGDKLVMEASLDQALAAVIGAPVKTPEATAATIVTGQKTQVSSPEIMDLVRKAATAYELSQQALKNGNWTEYGNKQTEMGNALKELKARLNK